MNVTKGLHQGALKIAPCTTQVFRLPETKYGMECTSKGNSMLKTDFYYLWLGGRHTSTYYRYYMP